MENTALILGSLSLSYSGVVLSLSALSGCCAFFGLQQRRRRDIFPAAAVMLPGMLLSLPLSRLIHWYSNTSQYASFSAALTDYSTGGFVVLGVFAAFLLSALLMYAFGVVRNLPALLDDLSCAGALAAAVGKLACLFSPVCRSKFTLKNEAFRRLPFMVSSTLSNGSTEWRIATFCLQSIAYFIIFLVALLFFLKKKKSGESFALTLSLMGAVHVVLDSTRYDAAYLRSNGFVSITQICCAVTLLTVMVLFSVRSVRVSGLQPRHFLYWLLWLSLAGVGGYCEYYVQRHGDTFLTTYSLMESCFLGTFVINCLLTRPLPRREKKEKAPASPRKEKTEAVPVIEYAEDSAQRKQSAPAPAVKEEPVPEAAPSAPVMPESVEKAPESFESAPESVESAPESAEKAPESVEIVVETPESATPEAEPAPKAPEEEKTEAPRRAERILVFTDADDD